MSKGVSIILTAWKTAKYIEECLDSVQAQTYFKTHKNYEILLGIDGCEETLDKVKEIKNKYKNLDVYYFEKNVGTYIVSNTLCCLAKYDYLMRFDTDDKMMKTYVEKMLEYMGKTQYQFARPKMYEMDKSHSEVLNCEGLISMTKAIFNEYGGYRPFVCSSDSELRKRISKFVKDGIVPEPIAYRRIHKDSLTQKDGTNMHSEYRMKLSRFISWEMIRIKEKKDAIIKCIVENPKKLLEDDTLSELIDVEAPNQDVNNTLYEEWEAIDANRRNSATTHKNGYSYPVVKACAGFHMFP